MILTAFSGFFRGAAVAAYKAAAGATDDQLKDAWAAQRRAQFFIDFVEAENSVGARVEIDHLGPTLLGMWVEVVATVANVEGRRVAFEVEVRDALDTVGRAKHVRFVVDLDKQRQRLESKAAKVKALGKS